MKKEVFIFLESERQERKCGSSSWRWLVSWACIPPTIIFNHFNIFIQVHKWSTIYCWNSPINFQHFRIVVKRWQMQDVSTCQRWTKLKFSSCPKNFRLFAPLPTLKCIRLWLAKESFTCALSFTGYDARNEIILLTEVQHFLQLSLSHVSLTVLFISTFPIRAM